MSKRTLALLLIIGGIVAILAVLLWLFYSAKRIPGSPLVPSGTVPSGILKGKTSPNGSPSPQSTAPATTIITPAERERQAQDALKQQAMVFVAREGSYSNADEFISIRGVYVDVTAGMQTVLELERQKLVAAHPARGAAWGQTSRSLSARVSSSLSVLDQTSAEVTVQAQVTVTAGDAPSSVTYQEIILSFQKVGDRWLVSRMTSRPLAL
ncbi:MAG: hypothetical protein Q7N87_01155 [Candidatus Uhrbacteria bacterium]|nr:hypothetical protein [Candidatus Uhrbacteria bacterium]